jgi:hypothetical protein
LFSNGFVESTGGNFTNLGVVGLPLVGKAESSSISNQIHFTFAHVQDSTQTEATNRQSNISLSPNPVTNQLKVVIDKYLGTQATVRVLHLSGKEVLKTSISRQINTINLGHLRGGMYILEVSQGKYKKYKRILKQ